MDSLRRGPSRSDLAAIEAEWPLIAAGLAELDAEIAALAGRPRVAARVPGMSELDRRRERRESARRLAAGALLAPDSWFGDAA